MTVSGSNQEKLISFLNPLIAGLGYDLVHIELVSGRQKLLRVFIDGPKGIGVEDCAKVSRALDEPLETQPIFGESPYELEVSSPGIDRPLRLLQDYERFAGREARIHVFRPLTAEELGNPIYQQKNPKQKNFVGVLKGVRQEKVRLSIQAPRDEEVMIPLSLISKANLEPNFDQLAKDKE